MQFARESIGLSRPAFVEKFGGSVRTLENNEKGRNEPGAILLDSFLALGVSATWILTGEGEMLTGAPRAVDQGAAVYNRDGVSEQTQLQGQQQRYMAAESSAPPVSLPAVDFALMRLCLGACVMVHGEAFAVEPTALQLEYACELYNLLIKQAATHDQGIKAGVADFIRLETRGIADQLRLLIHLTWARRYTPPRKKAPRPDHLPFEGI